MARSIEAVKAIDGAIALGFRLSDAVQNALGCPLAAFAAQHGFTSQALTMCLSAYEGRVYQPIRDAICAELEIPREYLDRLIDSQRPAEPAERSA